ncbi:MAG: MarR family winged helix-turn-helix transcriptional regulator [Streptosporangiaceae bacterium]
MTESAEPGVSTGLGTLLRHVLDAIDDDVAGVLADLGLAGYRPRFSPAVRTLVAHGPLPIRDLARAIGVTHSAASQTAAEMARRGLVTLEPGRDARQRVVHLTDAARRMLPAIEAEWAATAAAAAELDAELPFPLSDLVPMIAAALERRSFRQRIIESGWAREHPWFGEALAAAPTAPAEAAGPGPGSPG